MQDTFFNYQLSFPRVRNAANLYDSRLQEIFSTLKMLYPPGQLYIRIFKQEALLEIWNRDKDQFLFIKSCNFTATSGKAGPKQKEGDLQIPEGEYQITNFNPQSKFHLSLKINYPNQADSIRNKNIENRGGDIYIHGGNETAGCICIGDENISELYWLCVQAYTVNPFIPVHIFPCKMEENKLAALYEAYPMHIDFWNSIKPLYHFVF